MTSHEYPNPDVIASGQHNARSQSHLRIAVAKHEQLFRLILKLIGMSRFLTHVTARTGYAEPGVIEAFQH